jgi:hypothetical protein
VTYTNDGAGAGATVLDGATPPMLLSPLASYCMRSTRDCEVIAYPAVSIKKLQRGLRMLGDSYILVSLSLLLKMLTTVIHADGIIDLPIVVLIAVGSRVAVDGASLFSNEANLDLIEHRRNKKNLACCLYRCIQ